MSNAYPRLSDEAYEDKDIHRREVMENIVEEVAFMWRYYMSERLTEEEKAKLAAAIEAALPIVKDEVSSSTPTDTLQRVARTICPVEKFYTYGH